MSKKKSLVGYIGKGWTLRFQSLGDAHHPMICKTKMPIYRTEKVRITIEQIGD